MTDLPRLTLDPHPDPAEVRTVVEGLMSFNVERIGEAHEEQLGVFVRDDEGRVIGGLLGLIRWRWLHVAKLWLPDELRGRGFGTRLMRMAEDYARSRGCTHASLDTFEYQARPFYEKLGYAVVGTLEGFPPGYRQYYLARELGDAHASGARNDEQAQAAASRSPS